MTLPQFKTESHSTEYKNVMNKVCREQVSVTEKAIISDDFLTKEPIVNAHKHRLDIFLDELKKYINDDDTTKK